MVSVKENGITELRSDQESGKVQYERESFPIGNRGSRGKIDVSLGYRRGLDFDAENKPGQDFAVARGDGGGYVVGVVADGVSESFYGDIAAFELSASLMKMLWRERERPPSQGELERHLEELERIVATEIVENHPIPEDLEPWLRESLESRRPKGSQAVFAAFVLDTSKNRLDLYQVGDADALVHYPNKPPELVQAAPKGRWSSAGKSKLLLKPSTFEDATGIVIKSDGAGGNWGRSLKDRALNEDTFKLLADKRAGIDDLSFVAARWGEVQEGEMLEEQPPEPEIKRPRPTEPVPPPRGEETKTIPGARPYTPDTPPERDLPTIPGARPYTPGPPPRRDVPGRPGEPEVLIDTGRHTPGPPPRRGRPNRLRVVPLFAAGVVVGILMTLIIAVYFIGGDSPEVRDDSYSIGKSQLLHIEAPGGVLGNDTDADTLEVVEINPASGPSDVPDNGVTLYSDGSFDYRPQPGYIGEDSFTYRAGDGTNESDVATVTITVNNTAPVANNDPNGTNTYNVSVNQPLTIDAANGVLANDTDSDDGDSLTAQSESDPTNGELTLDANGSFTYTPDADFNGTDSFTYRANDGTDDSNTATVTITVGTANSAPTTQTQQILKDPPPKKGVNDGA